MKLLILSLLLPFQSMAKSPVVACNIQDLKLCQNCETRVKASCENHEFNGHLDLNVKPVAFVWTLSNSKTGTEKQATTANTKLSLKDLKASKDLKTFTGQLKLKATGDEQISLSEIQVPANTSLYRMANGKEIAAVMKKINYLRNVASTQEPQAGGVRRAQNPKK